MKKRMISLLLAAVMVFAILPGMGSAAGYESVWFPAPQLYLTQLAYESYSHGDQNAIDIAPGGTCFAPFTGKIVYTDPNWGYVMLQSSDKVYWADGSLDYMSVGFMHDSDISDLYVGKVISQGEAFYHAGGQGGVYSGNTLLYFSPNAYSAHVHLTVHKGHVTRGYPYGTGDRFAYDAFYINPGKTAVVKKGTVAAGNYTTTGSYTDYGDLWRTLPSGQPSSDNYLSQCTFVKSYLEVETTDKTTLKTLPCSKGTNADSKDVRDCTVGEQYLVTGLYCNTQNNYWYKVQYNGKDCYMYAGNAKVTNYKIGAEVRDVAAPSALSVGQRFSIKGTVYSDLTELRQAGAFIKSMDETVTYYQAYEEANGMPYNLLNSHVDYGMRFNELAEGWYKYIIYVGEKNYWSDGTTLYYETLWPPIYETTFKVGSPAEKSVNLDVNSYIDGNHIWDAIGYGTFDVYINGEKVANDVNDWCQLYPAGTNFVVNDIKAASGYVNRSQSSYSGTISGDADVHVELAFETKKTQYTNSILLNGKPISFDQAPVNINGRILVPVRAILEAMGASVDWDKYAKKVTATRNGTTVELIIDQLYLSQRQNGILAKWAMDVAAKIINGRTLIPARAVAEAFGCKVDWDPQNRNVIITT